MALNLAKKFAEGRRELAAADQANADSNSHARNAAELAFELKTVCKCTQTEIAEGFGCSQQKVSFLLQWRMRQYVGSWSFTSNTSKRQPGEKTPTQAETAERNALIVKRHDEGVPVRDIMPEVGRSESAVNKVIQTEKEKREAVAKAEAALKEKIIKTFDPIREFEERVRVEVKERIAKLFPLLEGQQKEAEDVRRAYNSAPLTSGEYQIICRAVREPVGPSKEKALKVLEEKQFVLCGSKR